MRETDNLIPLIWSQESVEAILLCRSCHDVAIYKFPVKYPINEIHCDFCDAKRLTSKMPRARQLWE